MATAAFPLLSPIDSASQGLFPETRWSLIALLRNEPEPPVKSRLLNQLCTHYWKPVYAYVRWKGLDQEDAKDLTQDIFNSLVDSARFEQMKREQGKLRTFLKAVAKRQVAGFFRNRGRKKRGGDWVRVDIDAKEVESSLAMPAEVPEPELAFDRKWAEAVLRCVEERLREHYEKNGRSNWFETVYPQISPGRGAVRYAELAKQLKTSVSSIKVGVHRMRKQYGELLRQEIAATVDGPEAVQAELEALYAAFRSS